MHGGGIWVSQNKVLPGAYINFVSAEKATANIGERGVVAIALPMGTTSSPTAGKVVEITASDFAQKQDELLKSAPKTTQVALRELFKNATKVYVFDSYVASSGTKKTVSEICKALDPYEFNIIAAYTKEQSDINAYVAQVKSWRDDYGKKCQAVVYNATTAPDYEGVINVVSTVSDSGADAHALVAWVAGAEAGCAVNASCTNKIYNGELTVTCNHTQSELEGFITAGKFAMHLVYGEVRVLEDVNSLTSTTADKGEDFKSNQTVRVCDQIANDIAKLYNTKYLGSIPNDASGRTSLWADIVKHHKELESLRAIENFDPADVVVTQGDTKKSVVVTDKVTVVNAMSILYMTVVVQ